jgi:outer membrane protein
VGGIARSEDLLGIYQQALTADPLMQQATATHLAAAETKTQALIGLLPIDLTANKDWAAIGSTKINSPANLSLALTANLFSWDSWVNLKQANATVAQAEANYAAAQQSLIQRVAQYYFAVLFAQDTLAAQQSALESLDRQLEQAERRFDVGLIAITDVQTTRAQRDIQSAAVIAAKRSLASAQEQLRTITNEPYPVLAGPGDDMPLLTPDPASEDKWVTTALDQNASLIASRMSAEIARDSLLTAYGGYVPSVTVSASRAWAIEHGNFGTSENITGGVGTALLGTSLLGATTDTTDIIWQVGISVPIFDGGSTPSKVRQARYNWHAAQSGLEYTSRQTQFQARDAYQGIISQIAQVQALKQAVESNRVSLEATQTGYDVGTKTVLDVLTARASLVEAQTSYAQAKYTYLNDIVALRLAAGNLDRATVVQINGWLKEPAPAAPPTP